MFNLHSYNMIKNVHVYRQGELNIAYDVNSGSLHILDHKTFTFLKELEMQQINKSDFFERIDPPEYLNLVGDSLTPNEKEEIFKELTELQKAGLIYSNEPEEVQPDYPSEPTIKAMCLHIAHDCNLRCKYCFAGTGPFGGSRELMTLQTGQKAIDFLLKHSGLRHQCEVDFFGGEPLMNVLVLRDLVAYGKEAAEKLNKQMKFTLTTNAVLLNDDIVDYLEREEISVVLSLDGRDEINDRMRPDLKGKGSYDRIVPKILNLVNKRPETSRFALGKYYYVRGTYTHHNTDFYHDVLHMADLGIKRISVEPVVASPQDDYAFKDSDLEVIKNSYDILGEKVLEYEREGKGFAFFHFNTGLDDGPCLPKRLSGCGAGHEYVAISPEGDIYPCHQFVGQEQYKMGSLHESDPGLNDDIIFKFRNAHVYNKEECRTCWARFSCSGGCHAANTAFSGELTKVYALGCELQKKRLEVAYYLRIREAEEKGSIS